MLKWAVSGTRQTYLQNEDSEELHVDPGISSRQRKKRLQRKSSDLSILRPKMSGLDKENQYTSTPLHTSSRRFLESTSCKMDSLKDLSNIVAELTYNSPLKSSTQKILNIPETTQTCKIETIPNNYASTLPTFEVEYSPCALIPGPVLALRGVGIPDSYFEKPRYMTSHLKEGLNNFNKELYLEAKTLQEPVASILKCPDFMEESALSSSKMGDVTLERMIDAILESNCKERKPQKSQKQLNLQKSNLSPTYAPAEDPASDLHEIWDSEKSRYRQKEQKFKLTKKSLFKERQICSPLLQENSDPTQLRRQHGLRRKRKINQITASVINSAQKLLSKGSQSQTLSTHSRNLRKVFKPEFIPEELRLQNLSPDSGHNSSSDYEEEQHVSSLERIKTDNKTLGNTKKRLSFSLQNSNKL